ncbi:MAG: hypothetical protein R3E39_01665 [Anaerolineae bacterium]
MAADLQSTLPCPACDGTGMRHRVYVFRTRNRAVASEVEIQRAEACTICKGIGTVSTLELEQWQRLQVLQICPVCNGSGGKRWWSWHETGQGTQKSFEYVPCVVCGGNERVTVAQLQTHEHERRKLQVWGVGCAVLVLVFGLCGVMQIATVVMGNTPWFQCCTLPHFLVSSAFIIGHRLVKV